MAEKEKIKTQKAVKTAPEKAKSTGTALKAEKAKTVVVLVKGEKEKKPNAIAHFWRETIGELRKVNWPTIPDARRLTYIVLAVMVAMAILLGVLDYIFSTVITLIVT